MALLEAAVTILISFQSLSDVLPKARDAGQARRGICAMKSNLRLHQNNFIGHLESLLAQLPEADGELEGLLENLGDEKWNDPNWDVAIQERYGEIYDSIQDRLGEMGTLLDQIQAGLKREEGEAGVALNRDDCLTSNLVKSFLGLSSENI